MFLMLFLFGLVIYYLLSIPVIWFFRKSTISPKRKRIITWVILVIWTLIPSADHMAGKLYHWYLCSYGGPGLHIYRKVNGISNIQMDDNSTGVALYLLEKYGYDFVESTKRYERDRYHRYSLDSEGKLVDQEIDQPLSHYAFRRYRKPLSLNQLQLEFTVEDRVTGKRLAEFREFGFFGGWVAVPRYSDYCPRPTGNFFRTFHTVVLGKDLIENGSK